MGFDIIEGKRTIRGGRTAQVKATGASAAVSRSASGKRDFTVRMLPAVATAAGFSLDDPIEFKWGNGLDEGRVLVVKDKNGSCSVRKYPKDGDVARYYEMRTSRLPEWIGDTPCAATPARVKPISPNSLLVHVPGAMLRQGPAIAAE